MTGGTQADAVGDAARQWFANEPPSLLTEYVDVWKETTDAPLVYMVAGGLATIATLLGRRVKMPFGGGVLYPNLWILTLGPSSFYRKTTCLTQARKTITKLDEEATFPDEFSRERLISTLERRAQGIFTFSEFSGFLATAKRDYMSGTKELLADLYDCPPLYCRETTTHGRIEIYEPCLSILSTSQTNWFLEKIDELDLRSGFLARFLFIPAYSKESHSPIPPPIDQARFDKLIERLRPMLQLTGERVLSADARMRYVQWVEAHEAELQLGDDEEKLSAFWTRLEPIALKLAMILDAASERDGGAIPVGAIDSAIGFAEVVKLGLRRLFRDELALTREERDCQKVMRYLAKRPGEQIDRRDLYRSLTMTSRNLDTALDTLAAREQVVIARMLDGGGKRTGVALITP